MAGTTAAVTITAIVAILIVALGWMFKGPSQSILLDFRGVKFSITGAQAKTALQEFFNAVMESVNDLGPTERKLFIAIRDAKGQKTLDELIKDVLSKEEFQRLLPDGSRTKELDLLRELGSRKFIRPFEGGNWQKGSHPVITDYVQLLLRVAPDAFEKRRDQL